MDITGEFNAYYREKLDQVHLPEKISSHYRVEACLASSAEKEVYLLSALQTGQRAILRVLTGPRAEANRGEYALLCALDHPRIPKAVDLFEEGGFSYLIRSYCEGIPLSQLVANRGALTQREVVRLSLQLCDILIYLHDRSPSVIHRDIKPQNVIVDANGAVSLIDFDIARKYNPQADLDTTYGGTSATAPPEQFGYAQTDVRSDLYSLGVLLIYLYTGSYERRFLREMPRGLSAIAEKCTQFSPRDRYASAAQVKKALMALRGQIPVRIALAAAGLICVAGAFLAGLLLRDGVSVLAQASPVPSPLPAPSASSAASARPTVAPDDFYVFASEEVGRLVRKKLGKKEGESVLRSELLTIRELSLIGVMEENVTMPFEVNGDQGYKDSKPITRGSITTLADFSQMKNLSILTLGYQRFVDLSPLKNLQLSQLVLPGNAISDLSPLSDMKTLETLELYSNPVRDLSPIANLGRSLRNLGLDQTLVTDLSPIRGFPRLEYVGVGGIPCPDFSVLLSLPNLNTVTMYECMQTDVKTVAGNKRIKEFAAWHCGITSLDVFAGLPDLRRLEVDRNPIGDLSGLENFQNLEILSVGELTGVDLAPLLRMPELQKVVCTKNMQDQIDKIKDKATFTIRYSG